MNILVLWTSFLFKVRFLLAIAVTVKVLRLVLDLCKNLMVKAFLVLPKRYLAAAKRE